MPEDFNDKLVIAISSQALFDLSESHQVFENKGLAAYSKYQIAHEAGFLSIGEFVETEDHLKRLQEIGLDYVQGYAIHTHELLTDQDSALS